MKPAYRPGLVPQVAMRPRMGARSRGQMINELMAGCPSLLDDLIFYPMWTGSRLVDLISGATLTNSANAVPPTGVFSSALSNALQLPSSNSLLMNESSFTAAVWCNPTAGGDQCIFGKYAPSIASREWGIFTRAAGNFGVLYSATGSSGTVLLSGETITLNQNHLVALARDDSYINIYTDGVYKNRAAFSGSLYKGTAPIALGSAPDGSFFDGWIGQTSIWRRILSAQEHYMLWTGFDRLSYPFR